MQSLIKIKHWLLKRETSILDELLLFIKNEKLFREKHIVTINELGRKVEEFEL